ncbi:hypothetical protein FE783_32190 [Paenibacillus mesophilus]|uniref:hypothetical protein n=1 Tax=Paenibacillus mesophilus TaxID=2582849 RepID=UPI00110EBCE8|nr:hypothetical protein [Paenibacillus mesophilus]TMV44455.1 hypothetical protein FE783_32190 [Paenibacillus mesophilus]
MSNKICLTVAAALLVMTVAGCGQANYRMKEERNPSHDRRGMKDERYLENRVNTNLPQGGTSPKDEVDMQQNIRPGDANGGNPPTVEGGNIPGPMGKTTR